MFSTSPPLASRNQDPPARPSHTHARTTIPETDRNPTNMSELLLPFELVTMVVEHCEHDNYPRGPNAEHIENPCNPSKFEPDSKYRVTWLGPSKSADQDICSIRLVCKQFKAASLPSFGAILGDRCFRLSESSLEDLRSISTTRGIIPHNKMLKFESLDYSQFVCRTPQSETHDHVSSDGHGVQLFHEATDAEKVRKEYNPLPVSIA